MHPDDATGNVYLRVAGAYLNILVEICTLMMPQETYIDG